MIRIRGGGVLSRSHGGSELGQLGVGAEDPPLASGKVDEDGEVSLDPHDSSESELIMRNPVPHLVVLNGRGGRGRDVEGTGRQVSPGSGWLCHYLQYAPTGRQMPCPPPTRLPGPAPRRAPTGPNDAGRPCAPPGVRDTVAGAVQDPARPSRWRSAASAVSGPAGSSKRVGIVGGASPFEYATGSLFERDGRRRAGPSRGPTASLRAWTVPPTADR